MPTIRFLVEDHFEWGGDEIGTFYSIEAATEETKKYLAELELDKGTGEDIEYPRLIMMVPQVDGWDVPTQAVSWVFSDNDWVDHPTVEDILSDYYKQA